jgi:hypothetical protein
MRGRLANFTPEETAELRAELVEELGRAQALAALRNPHLHVLSEAGPPTKPWRPGTSSSIRSRPSIA